MILTMLASDRSTVTPLSPPPHQGANRRTRHHPPANFELLLNGLASFELRRVFCSNEGACVRFTSRLPTIRCRRSGQPAGGGELEARWNKALARVAEVESKIAAHDAVKAAPVADPASLATLAADLD